MAGQGAAGPRPAAKRPLPVRQIEGQLTPIDADGQRPPHHLGGVRLPRPLNDQRAAGEGPEPPLRFPEARELIRRGGHRHDDQQEGEPAIHRIDFSYSACSADSGSTLAARIAGRRHPATAAARHSAVATAIVSGSSGRTPKSSAPMPLAAP